MVVSDLQRFLESPNLEGGSVSVDLLKIAKNVTQRQQPHNPNRKVRPVGNNKLKLIIDGENCLDRLYGGYFSDWACGGQWNRMVQFLSILTKALERGKIELAVVFNGTLEQSRMSEWVAEQANIRQRVGMVLKHINTKATPPPKVWWCPPTCLASSLRMALRYNEVTVMCSMDDHHQEVIAYCREYGFHGLMADDAEYAAFDPPRYFSSQNIKLTYKGSVETKEYMIGEMNKSLKLTQEQVCIVTALLGNFLIPEYEFNDLYKKLNLSTKISDNGVEKNIRALAEFVRTLPAPSDMDALVLAVFGSLEDKRASKFRQSVQYYLNGTASGFLKYCAPTVTQKEKKNKRNQQNTNNNAAAAKPEISPEAPDPSSSFASETSEQQQESIQNYKMATANAVLANFEGLSIQEDSNTADVNGLSNGIAGTSHAKTSQPETEDNKRVTIPAVQASPSRNTNSKKSKSKSSANLVTPSVSSDILRTASLRHQKGLMSPTILHVLSTQEIRLPCLMEDESNREFPPIHDIYRPLRQHVYAVLFNLHHLRYVHSQKKDLGEIPETAPQPDIVVKEWMYSRANPYQKPELVKAEPLSWGVPTLQRLWFGPAVDDKRRRMRALLSCLNSDTPLILNTSYVPQHMLIMACVLRYIISQERPILRRHELDAFICHAFNPNLMTPQYSSELTLNMVTSRGVQLASLFMKGVDMAMLANDACGAPLPWLMCCPWLYFDGKLFHYTLNRAAQAKNLLDVCENYIEIVVKVERMRKAILEGLDFKFAKPPMQQFAGGMLRPGIPPPPPPHCLPTLSLPSNRGAAALRHRPLPSRGGQLQVAGVVVGSWGGNYGFQSNHLRPQMVPAGYNVGGRGRGMAGLSAGAYGGRQQHYGPARGGGRGRGRGQNQQRKPGPPTYAINSAKKNQNKKRTNKKEKNSQPKELALTISTENGVIPASELILLEERSASAAAEGDASAGGKKEDCKEHKGQGDAPLSEAAALAN